MLPRQMPLTNFIECQDRGEFGTNKYRGNTSGEPFYQLGLFFEAKKGADFCVGGGTSKDVFEKLGIPYCVLDLNPKWGGFDLVNDEIPESSDFIIYHPPYWDMIKYSDNPKDMSNMSWEQFLKSNDKCIAKQYMSLRKGGRLAILVADRRKRGKLYSTFIDMIKPGEIEHIMIKKQVNCQSDKMNYSGKFIPILTEYLLILKKTDHYLVGGRQTVFFERDIRNSKNVTWRDVVYSAMEALGGKASLKELYTEIQTHFKTKTNPNWQAKTRQVLQLGKDFINVDKGVWSLVY